MCENCRERIQDNKDDGLPLHVAVNESRMQGQFYIALGMLNGETIVLWMAEQLQIIGEVYEEPDLIQKLVNAASAEAN